MKNTNETISNETTRATAQFVNDRTLYFPAVAAVNAAVVEYDQWLKEEGYVYYATYAQAFIGNALKGVFDRWADDIVWCDEPDSEDINALVSIGSQERINFSQVAGIGFLETEDGHNRLKALYDGTEETFTD